MLTQIQDKLLQMMKELDKLCRENDIHYTLGGGTAIGAIRNRGFLPWDDDIDLYMTRDNWERLKVVYEQDKFPPHRVLESAETDIRYTNTIGRYVTTDSSSVHSHQIIYDDPAGHVLDIFVFDPIHIRNYKSFVEELMLFSDLMDETKGYSSRFDMNLKRYPEALRKCESGHKSEVIGELIDRFTHMDDEGWTHYIMEWGVAPFLFPASIFEGGYIRVPFEDTTVEIVRNYSEYLVWQYGDDWRYVPAHSGREGHDAIFSNLLPYMIVRQDYLPFIDVHKVRAAYLRRKKRLLRANPHRRKAEISSLVQKAEDAAEALGKRLADTGQDINTLHTKCNEKQYYEIAPLFEDYLKQQLGTEFAGRRDKHSTLRRYMYPVLIPVEEGLICIAAEILMRTERMGKAARLIEIYTGEFEENFDTVRRKSEHLSDLREEILRARALINEYTVINDDSDGAVQSVRTQRERIADLYGCVTSFLELYDNNSYIWRLKARIILEHPDAAGNPGSEMKETLDRLGRLCPEGTPAHGEIRKYRADYYNADLEEYLDIYSDTNNGCIQLEIKDLLESRGITIGAEENIKTEFDDGQGDSGITGSAGSDSRDRNNLYSLARKLYKGIAGRDDRIKDNAWLIACRTRDRVTLLEEYCDRIPELENQLIAGDWGALRYEMQKHEAAMIRNYNIGLGLCVHPTLSRIQYELFRQDGRAELAEEIDALVPEQHRIPIV